MNRSLSLFVAFVAVLIAALIGVLLWLGPVAELAMDGDRRAAPYYVVALDKTGDLDALDVLVSEQAGEVLYRGALDHMLGGLVRRDEWRALSVYGFATAGDFLKLYTSEAFRAARGNGESRLLLGTGAAPDVGPGAAWVLWLARLQEDQILEAHSALLTTSQRYGGTSTWHADVDTIEGDAEWQTLRVVSFADARRAFSWHEDLRTQTEVALMSARYADSAGLLFAAR